MTKIVNTVFLLLAALGGLTDARAYTYPPLIPPVDQQTTLTLNLDRSTLGSTHHFLWKRQRNGWGGDGAPYRANNLHCYSATDPTFGAGNCLGSVVWGSAPTALALTFTEQLSQTTHVINLYGYAENIGCAGGKSFALNAYYFASCGGGGQYVLTYGKMFTIWIDENEINKLPFGGIWKAHLKLKQRNYAGPSEGYNAYWDGYIQVNLHDNKNFAIWFPQYRTSVPLLDLALHTLPTPATPGGKMTGKSTLDMCLYDGYNGNSNAFEVTLLDGKTIGDRTSEDFSLFRDGVASSDARKRIDYRIQLDYNGQPFTLQNNQPLLLTQINQSTLRPVKIPGVALPVFCAPTPLTFITPEFNQRDKEAGAYLGYVRVLFTPKL